MNAIKYTLIIFSLFLSSCHFSKERQDAATEEATWEDLRIQKLMPDYLVFPSINPCLPNDFIALADPKDSTKLYWGPKDVLETFFRTNGEQLTSAIIRVDISLDVSQINENSFSSEDSLAAAAKSQGINKVVMNKWKWGKHPVMNCSARMQGKEGHIAWIGLNYATQVLRLGLIYPSHLKSPSEKDTKMWSDFLKETKPLEMYEILKSQGQDLREGMTLVNVHGSLLQVYAEKRTKDQKIQALIKPMNDQISCKCENASDAYLHCAWHFNEPILNIKATLQKTGKANVILDQVIHVLLKEVAEFSFDEKDFDPNKISRKEYGAISVLNLCEKDLVNLQ